MAKQKKPDEYFRFGPIEIARFGKGVFFRSNWDDDEHRNHLKKVVEYGPVCKGIVDADVAVAIGLVRRNAPLEAMRAAYHLMCMEHSSIADEPEETEESVQAVHGLEFIQNVVASTKHALFTTDGNLDKDIPDIFRLVGRINRTVTRDFLAAEMLRNRDDPEKDSTLEVFRYEAINHWVHVRGERYTAHERENLEDLLLGHDDAIRQVLGLSSAELVDGVNRIIESLTMGFGDAVLEMKEIDEICSPDFLAAAEKTEVGISSLEEAQRLMQKIVAERGLTKRTSSAQEILQGYGLFDLGRITGWPHQCLDQLSWEIGQADQFLDGSEFSGWPTRATPISRRPFLKIENRYYCFSVFGLCDHFYRVVEKTVRSHSKEMTALWNLREKEVTETVPLKYFESLLPGCETIHDIHYRWFPNEDHPKREWCELDGLVLCGSHLIILEVKAIAFARKSPFENFGSHVGSFVNLISTPSRQGLRFLQYFQSDEEISIYDAKHKPLRTLRKVDYSHVTVCALSIDAFTEIASKMQHLTPLGIDLANEPVLPLSLDDLRVYRDAFTNPYRFLHFLEQRMKASRSLAVELDDELDHLGLYLEHNDYSLHAEDLKKGLDYVKFAGYRRNIDQFFHARLKDPDLISPLEHGISPLISKILCYFQALGDYRNSELTSELLNLCGESRNKLNDLVTYSLQRQPAKKSVIFGSMTGQVRLTVACWQPFLFHENTQALEKHAKIDLLMHDETDRMVLELTFSENSEITRISWRRIRRQEITSEEEAMLGPDILETKIRRIEKVRQEEGKVGRNRKCTCGSGLKFKRCCGKK